MKSRGSLPAPRRGSWPSTLPMFRNSGREHVAPVERGHADGLRHRWLADVRREAGKGKLDFVVNDMHKAPVKLSRLQGQGGAAEFLGDLVRPCKQEIPRFVELYKRIQGQGARDRRGVDRRCP